MSEIRGVTEEQLKEIEDAALEAVREALQDFGLNSLEASRVIKQKSDFARAISETARNLLLALSGPDTSKSEDAV